MSLNYREIDLILKELDLPGSRIDKIHQPDRFSLFLEIYSAKKKLFILISLEQSSVRIHRISSKPVFPDYPRRFTQLLRSRIKSGKIISALQPSGERIIQIQILCRKEVFNLWIRLWSGNPNIILTDSTDKIIDVLFRKPEKNEVAGELFQPDFTLIKGSSKSTKTIREYDGTHDFNQCIEFQYSESQDLRDFEKKREILLKNLSRKETNLQFHLKKLESRRMRFSRWNDFKEAGELISTNLYRIENGLQSIELEDYFNNSKMRIIDLIPKLTPQQNCERYFEKYKKYKQGLSLTIDEISIQEKLLAEIREKSSFVSRSQSLDELSQFSDLQTNRNFKKTGPKIGLLFHSGDFDILVGRNSRENDQLLRRSVRGNDMWLHVRDYPGGYVFIKTIRNKSYPLETLLDAANLALLYSGKKYKDKADIHYTAVKNLRRVKGGKEGLVLANNEKNLSIEYDKTRISRLQNKSLLETIHHITDN